MALCSDLFIPKPFSVFVTCVYCNIIWSHCITPCNSQSYKLKLETPPEMVWQTQFFFSFFFLFFYVDISDKKLRQDISIAISLHHITVYNLKTNRNELKPLLISWGLWNHTCGFWYLEQTLSWTKMCFHNMFTYWTFRKHIGLHGSVADKTIYISISCFIWLYTLMFYTIKLDILHVPH